MTNQENKLITVVQFLMINGYHIQDDGETIYIADTKPKMVLTISREAFNNVLLKTEMHKVRMFGRDIYRM